ncbi:MAG: hypothetical protein E7507_01190 [Ruminococcus sp.]|nr:hypothetical protein [Ruminococcus sp.]
MQLYLYDYESGENIFSWRPIEDQWWITGFAPDKTYNGIENQVMIGSVDFSGNENMYAKFEERYSDDIDFNKFLVFDDTNKVIWICWCEVDLI